MALTLHGPDGTGKTTWARGSRETAKRCPHGTAGTKPPRASGLEGQRATRLWAGIFLLLTAALAVLMVTEPVNVFLLLTTAVTVALVVAGTGASALWFLTVLRRLGLGLCFAQPEPGS